MFRYTVQVFLKGGNNVSFGYNTDLETEKDVVDSLSVKDEGHDTWILVEANTGCIRIRYSEIECIIARKTI